MGDSGTLIIVRHGITEWSEIGRHTGRTDIPLTGEGERSALALAPRFAGVHRDLVLCSPLQRARQTAQLAGLQVDAYEPDLMEWDYGAWEGLTTPQIREGRSEPSWTVWNSEPPSAGDTPGESLAQVGERVDRVLDRVRPAVAHGSTVVCVAHAHLLRILTARWLGLDPVHGRIFRLETAGVGTLGFERDTPVLLGWDGGLSA